MNRSRHQTSDDKLVGIGKVSHRLAVTPRQMASAFSSIRPRSWGVPTPPELQPSPPTHLKASSPINRARQVGARLNISSSSRKVATLMGFDLVTRLAVFAGALVVILSPHLVPWWSSLLAAAFAGTVSVGLASSAFHDAVHGNFPGGDRLNRSVARISGGPLGLSHEWWRIKHLRAHHPHVGDESYDPDIQFRLVARVTPRQSWRPSHRLQAVSLWAVMPLAALNMLLPTDLLRLFQLRRLRLGVAVEKYWFVVTCWVLVVMCRGFVFGSLLFVTFELVAGVLVGLVVQTQHNTFLTREGYSHPLPSGSLQQLARTSDVRSRFGIWWWISGGTNLHVAHHLLPRVPYVLLPTVSESMKRELTTSGILWHEHPNIRKAVLSIHRNVRTLSRKEPHYG